MQMVCGHEIGHDTFHRDLAKGNVPLPEFVLFDMRTKHEYEANAFASHLIIDDDELTVLKKKEPMGGGLSSEWNKHQPQADQAQLAVCTAL